MSTVYFSPYSECWLVYAKHSVHYSSKLKMKVHPLSRKLRTKLKCAWKSILPLPFTSLIPDNSASKMKSLNTRTCKTQKRTNRRDSDTKGEKGEKTEQNKEHLTLIDTFNLTQHVQGPTRCHK